MAWMRFNLQLFGGRGGSSGGGGGGRSAGQHIPNSEFANLKREPRVEFGEKFPIGINDIKNMTQIQFAILSYLNGEGFLPNIVDTKHSRFDDYGNIEYSYDGWRVSIDRISDNTVLSNIYNHPQTTYEVSWYALGKKHPSGMTKIDVDMSSHKALGPKGELYGTSDPVFIGKWTKEPSKKWLKAVNRK